MPSFLTFRTQSSIRNGLACLSLVMLSLAGCASHGPLGLPHQNPAFSVWEPPVAHRSSMTSDERVARLAGPQVASTVASTFTSVEARKSIQKVAVQQARSETGLAAAPKNYRAKPAIQSGSNYLNSGTIVRAQSPDASRIGSGQANDGSRVQQAAYQYPGNILCYTY